MMKTRKCSLNRSLAPWPKGVSGFSLVELLIAMLLFLIITGAAIRVIQKHVPMLNAQQSQAALNMNIRNAISQMQIDAVNAGTGYYPGANIPSFPIGLTIFNCGDPANGCNSMTGSGASCFNAATLTYGVNCFDQVNIIAIDTSIPPGHPADPGNSNNCHYTDQSSTLFVNPMNNSVSQSAYASAFHNGDELLLIKGDGSSMTTVTLTQDGVVTGQNVKLQHHPTNNGGNSNLPPAVNSWDPYDIANNSDALNNKLGTTFCNNDWVLRLTAITYLVDASNPADPQLKRVKDWGTPAAQSDVIADQVIGFKVGAMTWNTNEDQNTYLFNAPAATPSGTAPLGGCTSNYCGYNNDFSLIRSVLVSVIGRTPPAPADPFRNSFDGGPYKVESISVVINPRNLSMNDQ